MMPSKHCLLAVLLALAPALWAADPADPGVEVWAELEHPVTPFHRGGAFTIVAEGPVDIAFTFPTVPRKIGDVDIVPLGNTNTLVTESRRRMEQRYRLDPLKPEQILLPELTVKWGGEGSATLPPMIFTVRDLTDAEREAAAVMVDLQGTGEIAPPASNYTRGLLAGAALLAVAIGAFLWYRSRSGKTVAAPPKPAWEVALGRLNELEHRKLIESGKYGVFYVDLSSILRYYIEDRFNLRAPEQTTQEFLAIARSNGPFTEDQEAFLDRFLRHCDRVKFAQYEPLASEMTENLGLVRTFVKETIQTGTPSAVENEEAA